VANKPSWAKKAGITPGKIVLIAVLAVVLVGVLYIQFAPSTKPVLQAVRPAVVAAAAAAGTSNQTTKAADAAAAPRKKTGTVASWQSPDLTPIIDYDPFALPASFPQPQRPDEQMAMAQSATAAEDASAQQAALEAERAQSESELQGLRQQGVAVIIKKKKQYVAIVGEQEVHVGDQINGFTVIAIDADGVQVAKDLSP
jgi:hypothetical protein